MIKKKRFSWKVWFITGLILIFFSPILITPFALLFPDMSGEYAMLFFCFFIHAGVILFVVARARWRAENEVKQDKHLIHGFSLSQIVLITGMILLYVGEAIAASGHTVVGGRVAVNGFLAMLVAVALLCGKIKRQNDAQKTMRIVARLAQNPVTARSVKTPAAVQPQEAQPAKTQPAQQPAAAQPVKKPVPAPASNPYRPRVSCDRCRTIVYKDQIRSWNGCRICPDCLGIVEAAKTVDPFCDSTVPCSVCGKMPEHSEIILVDDQFICGQCMRERYGE